MDKILKIVFIILSILFVLPSILYLARYKTIYQFNQWFLFALNSSNRISQTILYFMLLLAITIIYILIIKNRNKIFKSFKQIIIFISVISLIFVFVIPFMSSDVFYYLGVGRLESEYNQNPYYTTIKQYVEENNPDLNNDTVLAQGYINYWSDTKVVYGPIWQIICKGVGTLSLGNVDIGLLVFKLVNATVHIMNCYLIYKITGKKIYSLIYGLNPFMLIEGIACVHNDIFMLLFTFLALYFMKKEKLSISMIFLAFATAIKYVSILLLPFIIIYYFRKEKAGKRLLNCVKYGLIFLVALVIPYFIYAKDLSVLTATLNQQSIICKSIYLVIHQYFPYISIEKLSTTFLEIFIIIYFFTCVTLLFKDKITLKNIFEKYTWFLLAFIFLLMTKFHPWYLMWLLPVFMYLKANNLKVIVATGILAEFANIVFLLNGEGFIYGTPFILAMYIAILVFAVAVEKKSQKRKIKCFTHRLKGNENEEK